MKFFGRQNEIKELQEIRNLSLQTARFTIVTGRRRSGKTSLLIKAYEDVLDMLYFFVARKSEAELCRDFIEEMTSKLQLPILGEVTRFADIFKYLLQLSKIRPITLVIDEFQDFKRANPSIFSDIQKIWDLNGATDKPCGGGLSTLTQNRFQTIHEERNVPDSFYLCSETFYL